MNKCLTFFAIIIFLSSCNDVVTGRVDGIKYNPWRGGNVLMYKISYSRSGRIDSTYLVGNKIYIKNTYSPFYFEVGDSITIKLGLTEYQNKFISIHKLMKRENKFVGNQVKTIGYSINRVDVPPLLPNAHNNDDNRFIINDLLKQVFQKNELEIKKNIVFYVNIDTLGKAHIHQVYSDDQRVVDCITKAVEELPLFTSAFNNGIKVNVVTSYELKK